MLSGKYSSGADLQPHTISDQITLNQMRINSMNTNMRFGEQTSAKNSSIGIGEAQIEEPRFVDEVSELNEGPHARRYTQYVGSDIPKYMADEDMQEPIRV